MFGNCLTMFSLKRWRKSAEKSIEIGLDYFGWSNEQNRLKQVLKLSDNIFVEVMKKSGSDVFWNRLTMFSSKRWGNSAETSTEIVLDYFGWSKEENRLKQLLKLSDNLFVEVMKESGSDVFWNRHTRFSLKWWRNPAQTCFEIVIQCFRWSDEGIRLEQILKLLDNNFVEATRKFGWDEF